MKKKLLLLLLLIFAFTWVGCKKDNANLEQVDNANMFLTKLQSALLVETEEYPEWLSLKIKEIESWEKEKSFIKVRIYQGEWKNRTIYFITNILSSCYFCDVYYEDGEQIRWDENNPDDFCIESKNWKLIFEYGDGLTY